MAPPTCAVPGHELEFEHELHGGYEEGQRFAGARFGGAHQVFALQQVRDRSRLPAETDVATVKQVADYKHNTARREIL